MIKAVIFDMDGVIVDSERCWQENQIVRMREIIPQITDKDLAKFIGSNLKDIYRLLQDNYNFEMSFDEFFKIVDNIATDIYTNKANMIPGCIELIERLNQKYPLAIASSSPVRWIGMVVDRFSLKKYFNEIVSFENINGKGKPAPDIFLHTAKLLGAATDECAVIEDSNKGVLAAKNAGMLCIAFNEKHNTQDLSEADIMIDDFNKVDKIIGDK